DDPSLGFSLDLGVVVPQYDVKDILFLYDHYDGGYLFRDKVNFIATPPKTDNGEWELLYGFDSDSPNQATKPAALKMNADGTMEFRVPIQQDSTPGIDADLVLKVKEWNA
ncbi:MAG TPA: hypothetical protein VGN88_10980, partial [Phycisphaerae bacterium]